MHSACCTMNATRRHSRSAIETLRNLLPNVSFLLRRFDSIIIFIYLSSVRPIVEETRQLRVNVDDFVIKALIGKGYFGNVHLVVERQTADVYAMKKIKKSVVTTSQVERDIMSRRSSEWLTNLQYAFQVSTN